MAKVLYVSCVPPKVERVFDSDHLVDGDLVPFNAQLSMLYALALDHEVCRVWYESEDYGNMSQYDFAFIDYRWSMTWRADKIRKAGIPYFVILTEGRDSIPPNGAKEDVVKFLNGSSGVWPMKDTIGGLVSRDTLIEYILPYSTKFFSQPSRRNEFLGRVEVYMPYGWEGIFESCKVIKDAAYTPVIRTQKHKVERIRRSLKLNGYGFVDIVPTVTVVEHAKSISENCDAMLHIGKVPIAGGSIPKAMLSGIPSVGGSHSYWQSKLMGCFECDDQNSIADTLSSVMIMMKSLPGGFYDSYNETLNMIDPDNDKYRKVLNSIIIDRIV